MFDVIASVIEKEGGVDDYLLIPVPTCAYRLWYRGVNHMALVVESMASILAMPFHMHGCGRKMSRFFQKGSGKQSRQQQVRGLFYGHRSVVEGKRIILVDDVMTTQSTLISCARCLYDCGARSVDAWVLSQVVL